jgi:hypothetical protein
MTYYRFTNIAARLIAVTLLFGVFSISAKATTVMVFPPVSCVGPSCFTSNDNGGEDADVFSQLSGLDLLYKAESFDPKNVEPPPLTGTPQAESGSFKDSYTTDFMFFATNLDEGYAGAEITHDAGTPSIDCSVECYLVVKDGAQEPARYLFNLALDPYTWDGVMELKLSGFWQNGFRGSDGKGSISHVAIYGVSPIPVPAAFWLFGTALIGFIGYSRRRSV